MLGFFSDLIQYIHTYLNTSDFLSIDSVFNAMITFYFLTKSVQQYSVNCNELFKLHTITSISETQNKM